MRSSDELSALSCRQEIYCTANLKSSFLIQELSRHISMTQVLFILTTCLQSKRLRNARLWRLWYEIPSLCNYNDMTQIHFENTVEVILEHGTKIPQILSWPWHKIRMTLGHFPLASLQELIKGGARDNVVEPRRWSNYFFSIWHRSDCGNMSSLPAWLQSYLR